MITTTLIVIFLCGFAVGCCASFILVGIIQARREAALVREHLWSSNQEPTELDQ